MEKTMVAEVISDLKSVSRLKIFEKQATEDVFKPEFNATLENWYEVIKGLRDNRLGGGEGGGVIARKNC